MSRLVTHVVLLGFVVALTSCDRGPRSGSVDHLTADQQAEIQKIYEQDGQRLVSLRQQSMRKHYELGANDPADQNRERALMKDISELDAQVLRTETSMQQRLAAAGCPMCGVPGMSGHMGGMAPNMGGPWMRDRSNMMGWNRLTTDQQTKAQKVYATDGQKLLALRQQLTSKQYELDALVASGRSDEVRIQTLTKEIGDLTAQVLQAETAMQRRLAEAGVPPWSYGMCPMCGMVMGPDARMGMMGRGMMGRGMMGQGMGGRMMDGSWDGCGW